MSHDTWNDFPWTDSFREEMRRKALASAQTAVGAVSREDVVAWLQRNPNDRVAIMHEAYGSSKLTAADLAVLLRADRNRAQEALAILGGQP